MTRPSPRHRPKKSCACCLSPTKHSHDTPSPAAGKGKDGRKRTNKANVSATESSDDQLAFADNSFREMDFSSDASRPMSETDESMCGQQQAHYSDGEMMGETPENQDTVPEDVHHQNQGIDLEASKEGENTGCFSCTY